MVDNFNDVIERDIEDYTDSIRKTIRNIARDIDGLEVMGNKLAESNTFDDFLDVLGYLEYLQEDSIHCNMLIHKALETRRISNRYNKRGKGMMNNG